MLSYDQLQCDKEVVNYLKSFILQYFLPFATKCINKLIEEAILKADKLGVKVISLAALNKVGISIVLL